MNDWIPNLSSRVPQEDDYDIDELLAEIDELKKENEALKDKINKYQQKMDARKNLIEGGIGL